MYFLLCEIITWKFLICNLLVAASTKQINEEANSWLVEYTQ